MLPDYYYYFLFYFIYIFLLQKLNAKVSFTELEDKTHQVALTSYNCKTAVLNLTERTVNYIPCTIIVLPVS